MRVLALLAAALGSCYFTFLLLLAIQGALLALLPRRWFSAVSFAVQVTLLVALLCAFPLFPYFPAAHLIATHSPWLERLPPAWFWGLAQWMIGDGNASLAWRAGIGLACAGALAAAGYLVSYMQSCASRPNRPAADGRPGSPASGYSRSPAPRA
jgi:hypothetical protein